MALEQTRDDSSHYEVSLTAGQAFIAFVLLLFSLAASFAFGVIIGKERNSEPLIANRATPVIVEGRSRADSAKIGGLGVDDAPSARIIEEEQARGEAEPAVRDAAQGNSAAVIPAVGSETPVTTTAGSKQSAQTGPWYAQLLSTSDVKSAEALAARLIDNGYTSAYVQRNEGEQGKVFRVRVRFPDEGAARAAAAPLKAFSKGDVWVTRQ